MTRGVGVNSRGVGVRGLKGEGRFGEQGDGRGLGEGKRGE